MDEQQWLTSENQQEMLRYLTQAEQRSMNIVTGEKHVDYTSRKRPLISDRKLRLFAEEWFRTILPHNPENESALLESTEHLLYVCQNFNRDQFHESVNPCGILREIVGNPFKEVAVYDQWSKQGDVYYLAANIYDSGEFDGMPILGDALEEAGCTNDEILRHCRQEERCPGCEVDTKRGDVMKVSGIEFSAKPEGYVSVTTAYPECKHCDGTGWIPKRSPCVRGCWLLDLILGKE